MPTHRLKLMFDPYVTPRLLAKKLAGETGFCGFTDGRKLTAS